MDDAFLKQVAGLLENQNQILAALAQGKSYNPPNPRMKAPAVINQANLLQGSGGIFTTPGLEPDIITAYVRPKGLVSELEWFPSIMEFPRFGTITGFTGTSGEEAVNPCDNNPAGYMKGCNLSAQFGRYARDTQTIEFDKVMLQVHAGVTTDLVMRGRLLGLDNVNPAGLSEAEVLNIVTMAEMVGVGAQLERLLSRQLWRGNPANNTANGGYKEFPGLDRQIATGQVDADSAVACPALDSDVKDFALNLVSGATPSIVTYLSQLEFYLRYNAERMGLDPVEWVIAMRPELWFELSATWPCQYNTNRCSPSVSANATVFIDGRENTDETNAMRQGGYIEINGNRYRVVTDTGITELTNITTAGIPAGQYASSIYMVPLRITGGFPVTYLEHVDYRAGARDVSLLMGKEQFWTDRGMYSWALEQIKWCYKLSAKVEPRVVLRTPQLAGRIDRIRYAPLQHLREPYSDSPYFADGGVSIRGTATAGSHVW